MIKARDRQATEEKILKAALIEFSDKGFEGARVDSIAERSGFNKAMIYHYFNNKEVLYERILKDTTGGIFEKLHEVASVSKEPVELFELFLVRYMEVLGTVDRNVIKIILRELASGGKYFRKVALPNLMLPMISILEKIFEDGIRLQQIRPLNPYLTLFQLIGGIIFFNMIKTPMEGTPLYEKLFSGNYLDEFRKNYLSIIREGIELKR